MLEPLTWAEADDIAHEQGYTDGSHRHPVNNNPYWTEPARSLYIDGWVDGWKMQKAMFI